MTDSVALALVSAARTLGDLAEYDDPVPGDLVIETSKQGRSDPDAIGYLKEVFRHVPRVHADFELVWVVEPLRTRGGAVTWVNAEFHKVSPEIETLVKALS